MDAVDFEGLILWTLLWTLFVNTLCGHFLWSLFVETFMDIFCGHKYITISPPQKRRKKEEKINFPPQKKSPFGSFLSILVLVLLSASIKRFSVYLMQDICIEEGEK